MDYLVATRRFDGSLFNNSWTSTTQKMKFSIKDFFSKCDQIRSLLRIWSHLLKKSLTENFTFCAVKVKCVFLFDHNLIHHSYYHSHILWQFCFRSYILDYLVYILFISCTFFEVFELDSFFRRYISLYI